MRVSELKSRNRPLKLMILAYNSNATELLKDFEDKYNLEHLMKEFKLEPMTLEELSEGRR